MFLVPGRTLQSQICEGLQDMTDCPTKSPASGVSRAYKAVYITYLSATIHSPARMEILYLQQPLQNNNHARIRHQNDIPELSP
jgi:hypothetical protein